MSNYYKYKTGGGVAPPPFWLKVRKDYVLENFHELVEYMQKYPYRHDVPNPDYDDTLACMSELSLDFAREFASTPFYTVPEFSVPTDRVAALLGATVLARVKKDLPVSDILMPLAALLLSAYPDLPQGTQSGLWRVMTSCALDRRINRTTFSWRSVSGEIHPRILAELVAETTFAPIERYDERLWLENGGLMTVAADGMVSLSTSNLTDYRQMRSGTQFLGGAGLTPRGMSEIRVRNKDVEKFQSFEEAYRGGAALLRSLSEFRPSPSRRLKEYSEGDTLPAVVTSKVGIKLAVKSIDPEYKTLQGNVYMRLDPDHRPSVDVIREYIRVGDIVEVTVSRSLNCIFDLSPNLESYYRILGCSFANQIMGAIYDRPYAAGTQWINDNGIRVGIARNKVDELNDDDLDIFDNAMEHGTAVALRAYKDEPKRDGVNFYVYASPEMEHNDDIEPFGRQEADENFADSFLSHCESTYGHLRESDDPWKELSPVAADLLARTMAVLADDVSRTSRERLDNLLCAAMACHITGREKDYEFLHQEILYLSRLVDFAQGREIRPLPAADTPDERAGDVRRGHMLDQLRNYRTPGIDLSAAAGTDSGYADDRDLMDRVAKLIEASNSLAGIIRPRELDNIKRTIAATLGVDDEYRSILSDRKWYGDESEQLEFKVSVVFPPLNRRRNNLVADPEGQKWAIIKAVCAFLNSADGGTLLIGVNDYGFAEGVEPDIQELFKMKYISKPDMDRYMQYVMRFIDTAFREQNGNKSGNDIVAGRVRYTPEESPEGKKLLRLTISPYPHDLVEIQGELPDGLAQSYVRGSGRSEPLTSVLAAELRARRGKE